MLSSVLLADVSTDSPSQGKRLIGAGSQELCSFQSEASTQRNKLLQSSRATALSAYTAHLRVNFHLNVVWTSEPPSKASSQNKAIRTRPLRKVTHKNTSAPSLEGKGNVAEEMIPVFPISALQP